MNQRLEARTPPADELYEDAFARLGEGAFREAIAQLKRAVALEPQQPKYVTALAKVYDIIGEREQAGNLLTQAIRLRRKAMRQS